MKHIAKRAFSALALAGLIPAASLAQPENTPCVEEAKLSSEASVATYIWDTDYGLAAESTVYLHPKYPVSGLQVSDRSDGPILKIDRVLESYDGTIEVESANIVLSDLSDQWNCAELIIDGETVSRECAVDETGQIKFNWWSVYYPENVTTLEVRLGDNTVQNRPTLVYDHSTAATGFGRLADNKILSLWNRAARGECVPIQEDCFLTTATCEVIGLADDCWELQTLRRFRDRWLSKQPGGSADIARYYRDAPQIAERLRRDPDAAVCEYWRFILPSAIAASLGANETARTLYTRGMNRLAGKIV